MYCEFDVSALLRQVITTLGYDAKSASVKVEKTVLTSPGRAVLSFFFKAIVPPFHREDSCYLCIVGKSKFYTRSRSLQFHRMLRNTAIYEIGTPVW